jgi:hypothetical protein
MHHTKSLNLVALSRPAVNFILNRLSLGPFIDQLERSDYGMDEVFMSSLNSNLPDFPGGYTWRCLEHYKQEQEQVARLRRFGNSFLSQLPSISIFSING